MRFHKWLDQLRQRAQTGKSVVPTRRRDQAPVQAPSELFETRQLLSVSTLLVGGELSIVIDGADSVSVRPNPNDTTPADGAPLQVLENGVATSTIGNVNTQTVQSIRIQGGGGANSIDLSAVSIKRRLIVSR